MVKTPGKDYNKKEELVLELEQRKQAVKEPDEKVRQANKKPMDKTADISINRK